MIWAKDYSISYLYRPMDPVTFIACFYPLDVSRIWRLVLSCGVRRGLVSFVVRLTTSWGLEASLSLSLSLSLSVCSKQNKKVK